MLCGAACVYRIHNEVVGGRDIGLQLFNGSETRIMCKCTIEYTSGCIHTYVYVHHKYVYHVYMCSVYTYLYAHEYMERNRETWKTRADRQNQ